MNIYEINAQLLSEIGGLGDDIDILEDQIRALERENKDLSNALDIVWGEFKRSYPVSADRLRDSSQLLKELVA